MMFLEVVPDEFLADGDNALFALLYNKDERVWWILSHHEMTEFKIGGKLGSKIRLVDWTQTCLSENLLNWDPWRKCLIKDLKNLKI